MRKHGDERLRSEIVRAERTQCAGAGRFRGGRRARSAQSTPRMGPDRQRGDGRFSTDRQRFFGPTRVRSTACATSSPLASFSETSISYSSFSLPVKYGQAAVPVIVPRAFFR